MDADGDGVALRLSLQRPALAAPPFRLDVDLRLPGRGVSAIYGQSGSGKTTLIRCMAGLERATGHLSVKGELWQQGSLFLPPHKRSLGYVFQEHSLFAHLSAKGNLQYALKRTKTPVDPAFYAKVLAVLGIQSLLEHQPHQLSGGERQRVAMARALLTKPRILLMDEPLASLDVARKQEILPYLESLTQQFDLPIIYVSHALDEVTRLAEHLVLLEQGQVSASGPLRTVLSRLDLPLVQEEGAGVVLPARVVAKDQQWQLARVAFAGGELWLRDKGEPVGTVVRVRVLARDVSIGLAADTSSSILNELPASVVEIVAPNDDALALVRMAVGEEFVVARLARKSVAQLQLAVGKAVLARIKSAAVIR